MSEASEITKQRALINAAVAELIQLGFSGKVAQEIKKHLLNHALHPYQERNKELALITSRASEGQCLELSGIALYHLSKKYSDLFPTAVLIQIEPTDTEKAHVKFGWTYHSGVIMQDVLGSWHFISPANYKPSQPEDSLLFTHFESKSLNQVLDQVAAQTFIKPSPLSTPTSSEIIHFVNNHNTSPSRNQRQPYIIEVPVLIKFSGKVVPGTTSLVLN